MTSDSLVQIVLNKVQSRHALHGIRLLLKSPFWLWLTIKYDKLKFFFVWLKTDILQQTFINKPISECVRMACDTQAAKLATSLSKRTLR